MMGFKKIGIMLVLALGGSSVLATDVLRAQSQGILPSSFNTGVTSANQVNASVNPKNGEALPPQESANAIQEMEQRELLAKNIESSKVFGQWLFNGTFGKNNIKGFNARYKVSSGDTVLVKLWGVINQEYRLSVDKQGNVFVPEVGPVHVLGIENQQLNALVSAAISKVYKNNVFSYVTLESEQPVKVYVTGFAVSPGLYAGLSSDSVLYYLDKAGGIDAQRGSYLKIELLRGGKSIATFNLYDFLLSGKIEEQQLKDGDVISVAPKQKSITAQGDVKSAFAFEFEKERAVTVQMLSQLAKVSASVNRVYIYKQNAVKKSIDALDIQSSQAIELEDGDRVVFETDKSEQNVWVRLEGEHESNKGLVFKKGSTIGDVLRVIEPSALTDLSGIKLYRKSVKEKQKEALLSSLRIFEEQFMSASAGTKNVAELKDKEWSSVSKWIESAKKVEPKGQVILGNNINVTQVYLEEGDVLELPRKSWLVSVYGQVLQPTSLVWDGALDLEKYIEQAGGYLSNANTKSVVIKKSSGVVRIVELGTWSKVKIEKGDEIFVLPKIDTKNTQLAKDWTELLYQIAVGASIVLKL